MATEGHPSPKGPYKLVTCNQNPERAKVIVGRLLEELKDIYTIHYLANSTSIDGVKAMVEQHRPDLLFTASMWTPEEAKEIISIAKEVVPDVKTMSMPKGLQAEKGTDAVIEYAKNYLPNILE